MSPAAVERVERSTGARAVARVSAEFMEMPGLRLSCRQAQRLFGLDERVCRSVLDQLVRSAFLVRHADDTYGRPS